MTSSIHRTGAVLLACAGLWAGSALAQPQGGGAPGGPGGHRGPPAEALAACKSLAAGKACSFSIGTDKVQGSCWAPEGRPLACKPKDAPTPGAQTPKPGTK